MSPLSRSLVSRARFSFVDRVADEAVIRPDEIAPTREVLWQQIRDSVSRMSGEARKHVT